MRSSIWQLQREIYYYNPTLPRMYDQWQTTLTVLLESLTLVKAEIKEVASSCRNESIRINQVQERLDRELDNLRQLLNDQDKRSVSQDAQHTEKIKALEQLVENYVVAIGRQTDTQTKTIQTLYKDLSNLQSRIEQRLNDLEATVDRNSDVVRNIANPIAWFLSLNIFSQLALGLIALAVLMAFIWLTAHIN